MITALDPERDKLTALLRAWEASIEPEQWLTAKELIEKAEGSFDTEVGDSREELHEAIEEACPRATAVLLGRYLTKYARRIVDGRSIQTDARVGRSTRFRLQVE